MGHNSVSTYDRMGYGNETMLLVIFTYMREWSLRMRSTHIVVSCTFHEYSESVFEDVESRNENQDTEDERTDRIDNCPRGLMGKKSVNVRFQAN